MPNSKFIQSCNSAIRKSCGRKPRRVLADPPLFSGSKFPQTRARSLRPSLRPSLISSPHHTRATPNSSPRSNAALSCASGEPGESVAGRVPPPTSAGAAASDEDAPPAARRAIATDADGREGTRRTRWDGQGCARARAQGREPREGSRSVSPCLRCGLSPSRLVQLGQLDDGTMLRAQSTSPLGPLQDASELLSLSRPPR